MPRQQPDAIGLAVARAAQEAASEATVILFGSRARGDHRPDSDVDLLVIVDEGVSAVWSRGYGAASRAALDKLKECPGRFGVDVIPITRESFAYCRQARNHIAAQALRDGVIMNDDEFDDLCDDYDDNYPPGWPDIRQRLINARRWLGTMNHNIDTRLDDQEAIGFMAQQAVENVLKGWISAIDCEYRNIHHILELAEVLQDNLPEDSSPARAELDALVEWIFLSEEKRAALGLRAHDPRDWLSLYAVMYRYGGAKHRLNAVGYRELQQRITQAVTAFVTEIHCTTGTGAGRFGQWQVREMTQQDIMAAAFENWHPPNKRASRRYATRN